MTNVEDKIHIPVLSNEVIEYLRCEKGKIYLDCTLGGGGHATSIADIVCPEGRIVAIDRDAQAIAHAKKRLINFGECITYHQGNFADIDVVLGACTNKLFDGILMDLGFSSMQIDEAARGFSLMRSGPLDMRMDKRQSLTALDIVNKWSEDELRRIFREYGEERAWKKIARAIVNTRGHKTIETTTELRTVVESTVPRKFRGHMINPATKTFQALRIAVNNELANLEKALPAVLGRLKEGGRLAVISYHSLEDRIVKRFFVLNAKGCICPPEIPQCRCGKKPTLKIITRKVIIPTNDEIDRNPRARSAKMRVCERLGIKGDGSF